MTTRLASRLRRVEERARLVNEVDAILDSLDSYQSEAIQLRLIAYLEDQLASLKGFPSRLGRATSGFWPALCTTGLNTSRC